MATKKTHTVTRYTKAELIENAAIFKVNPEIVAGALVDVEDASKAEAFRAIDTFLKRPKKGAE